MAFWAYILRCRDGRFYTGQTDDLDRRLAEHQQGGFCDFTSRRRPGELAWSQDFSTRDAAKEAEYRIKPWSRAKKQALIDGDWARLSFFAKPPSERPSTSLGTAETINIDNQKEPSVPSEAEGPALGLGETRATPCP